MYLFRWLGMENVAEEKDACDGSERTCSNKLYRYRCISLSPIGVLSCGQC